MQRMMKILLISTAILLFSTTISFAQVMAGPPMMCGATEMIMDMSVHKFKEIEFMVLQSDKENKGPYYILYRNEKTGTWSVVAFNVPKAPPGIICVIQGGYASFILPDLNAIKHMLEKQKNGFDKPDDPDTTPDKET